MVRSEQKSEASESAGGGGGARGVPGALSNQPPAGSTAAANASPGAASAAAQATGSSRRESTVNYEIDKTVRHTKNPVGAVKRLSAAVVVNYRRSGDAPVAKGTFKPLSAEEIAQITALAKEAMGYSQSRGDTLNVANAVFNVAELEAVPELPFWQQPENVSLARDLGKGLLIGALFLYLLFGVIRPLVRTLSSAPRLEPANMASLPQPLGAERPALGHADRVTAARQLAKNDPKMVANVVKSWVSSDE